MFPRICPGHEVPSARRGLDCAVVQVELRLFSHGGRCSPRTVAMEHRAKTAPGYFARGLRGLGGAAGGPGAPVQAGHPRERSRTLVRLAAQMCFLGRRYRYNLEVICPTRRNYFQCGEPVGGIDDYRSIRVGNKGNTRRYTQKTADVSFLSPSAYSARTVRGNNRSHGRRRTGERGHFSF
jgi:hypothetical protein